ncbi:MAG: hypothetical protein R3C58_10980 [Parvularculaceae bacterium]
MVERVRSVRLNNQRIEALVEQLYDINCRLMALEGKLVRLAESFTASIVRSSSPGLLVTPSSTPNGSTASRRRRARAGRISSRKARSKF